MVELTIPLAKQQFDYAVDQVERVQHHCSSTTHPIQVLIHQSHFYNNCKTLIQLCSPKYIVCAVVKADAYGHGLAQVLPVAYQSGITVFGVVHNEEIATIRAQNKIVRVIRLRIGTYQEIEEAICKGWNVEEMVDTVETVKVIASIAQNYKSTPVKIHWNWDTGMGAMGLPCQLMPNASDLQRQLQEIDQLQHVQLVGIMTHCSSADIEKINHAKTQVNTFQELVRQVIPEDRDILIHVANTPTTLRYLLQHKEPVTVKKEKWKWMVRLGSALYGTRTSWNVSLPKELQPIMTVKTSVVQVNTFPKGTCIGYGNSFVTALDKTVVAVIPMGFSEGLLRNLYHQGKNHGSVLIQGTKCPLIGKLSANYATIDVTELVQTNRRSISIGEEVIVVGKQGKEQILAEEVAEWADTIHTEFHIAVGRNNPKIFV